MNPLVNLLLQLAPVVLSWDTFGWTVGFLLIMFLSAKEMVRAYVATRYGDKRLRTWMRQFDVIILPLLLLFGLALLQRILTVISIR